MSMFKKYINQISEGDFSSPDSEFIAAQEDSAIAARLHQAAEIVFEVAISIDSEDFADQLDELFEEMRAMIMDMGTT